MSVSLNPLPRLRVGAYALPFNRQAGKITYPGIEQDDCLTIQRVLERCQYGIKHNYQSMSGVWHPGNYVQVQKFYDDISDQNSMPVGECLRLVYSVSRDLYKTLAQKYLILGAVGREFIYFDNPGSHNFIVMLNRSDDDVKEFINTNSDANIGLSFNDTKIDDEFLSNLLKNLQNFRNVYIVDPSFGVAGKLGAIGQANLITWYQINNLFNPALAFKSYDYNAVSGDHRFDSLGCVESDKITCGLNPLGPISYLAPMFLGYFNADGLVNFGFSQRSGNLVPALQFKPHPASRMAIQICEIANRGTLDAWLRPNDPLALFIKRIEDPNTIIKQVS